MKGLLLINLGSPDSTSIRDVKKYLDEFLMDKRVIGKSYIFRWILVKLVILNIRPRKSAKAYKKIWWKEGSPLIVLFSDSMDTFPIRFKFSKSVNSILFADPLNTLSFSKILI